MKEEKDILNRDVEIPEVVFRKADAALNQIRANTESTKATRKVTRIQGRIHHVQAADRSRRNHCDGSSHSPPVEPRYAGKYSGNRRTAEKSDGSGNGDAV